MKKKVYTLSFFIILFAVLYFVDRTFFMRSRVLNHNLWVQDSGDRIRGDFIETRYVTFKGDTMIFDFNKFAHERDPNKFYKYRPNDTLILVRAYFKTMVVMDPKTKKKAKYSMKGG